MRAVIHAPLKEGCKGFGFVLHFIYELRKIFVCLIIIINLDTLPRKHSTSRHKTPILVKRDETNDCHHLQVSHQATPISQNLQPIQGLELLLTMEFLSTVVIILAILCFILALFAFSFDLQI